MLKYHLKRNLNHALSCIHIQGYASFWQFQFILLEYISLFFHSLPSLWFRLREIYQKEAQMCHQEHGTMRTCTTRNTTGHSWARTLPCQLNLTHCSNTDPGKAMLSWGAGNSSDTQGKKRETPLAAAFNDPRGLL